MLADHDNDHAVMEWADHAVAPTNASRTIRNLDIVEKFPASNNEGFVAEALISNYEIHVPSSSNRSRQPLR